ncbi:hypothetical protein [Clostridium estertheticum]|uniref:hypothetical protein n=1 Tax=Clostridium estertheticum TaxID=238834 RepID=UPI001CF419AD|nr:hypothetical protein [Clostridium estertheticum]MCB2340403.1 hypothetical protein [Clostridium estertheticum]
MNNIDWSEIDGYEKEDEFVEAKNSLMKKWYENPYDLKVLIRASFINWYLLVEWERTKHLNIDCDELADRINEIYDFGIKKFNENGEFLLVFGYMMNVSPENFASCNYTSSYDNGMLMLKKAFKINPNNDLIKLIYDRSINKGNLTKTMCENIVRYIDEKFSVDSIISDYVKSVILQIES